MDNLQIPSIFDNNSEQWETYSESLVLWFIFCLSICVNIMEDNDACGIRRRGILLSLLSGATYQLAAYLMTHDDLSTVSFDDLLNTLDKHFAEVQKDFVKPINDAKETGSPSRADQMDLALDAVELVKTESSSNIDEDTLANGCRFDKVLCSICGCDNHMIGQCPYLC